MSPDSSYEATWESVSTHRVPTWYEDAKLGVFLHWGLYSVPAWAERVPDIQTILRRHRPAWMLRHNPYAEWYANTVQLSGSPTRRHHDDTFGRGFPYDGFVPLFDEASSRADLEGLASVCRAGGGPLRGTHDKAPRRLLLVADGATPPGEGRLPRGP